MWGVIDTNGRVANHRGLWKRIVVPRVHNIYRESLYPTYFNVQVKELVRLSLNQPVKLFVDSNTDTAYNLQQEFVRIRTKHEGDREAIVAGESLYTVRGKILEWEKIGEFGE